MRKGYEYFLSNFFYRVVFLFLEVVYFVFFLFYISIEMDCFYLSYIILNVMVKNEIEWILKNGLGVEMVKVNIYMYKGFIVYLIYGYYFFLNFDYSLDVSIIIYVEINILEYSSFYCV